MIPEPVGFIARVNFANDLAEMKVGSDGVGDDVAALPDIVVLVGVAAEPKVASNGYRVTLAEAVDEVAGMIAASWHWAPAPRGCAPSALMLVRKPRCRNRGSNH